MTTMTLKSQDDLLHIIFGFGQQKEVISTNRSIAIKAVFMIWHLIHIPTSIARHHQHAIESEFDDRAEDHGEGADGGHETKIGRARWSSDRR